MIKLQNGGFSIDCEASGEPKRQITGTAVPWDVVTTDSMGTKVLFKKGSLSESGRAPKLIGGHDHSKIFGLVTERVSTDTEMLFTAKLADTRDANDQMQLLLMGAIDAVSVGVVPQKFTYDKSGTMIVESATWHELSLVAVPAFEQARIDTVLASAPEETEPTETATEQENPVNIETPAVTEASAPAVIPTQTLWAQPRREFKMPTPAEYISAFAQGGATFAAMQDKIHEFAAPDVGTADIPGILPIPIVQPIYNNLVGMRPVVDAMGVRAMPGGGKVFIRPKVITNVSQGAVTENTTITAGEFEVDDLQVTKGIYGGYVELSEASIDWSSPEILGALLDDMARVYANTTDNVAADALVAATTNTNNFTAADIAKPEVWAAWIYQAAADILTDSNGNLPNVLVMAPNRWQSLGNLSDDSGRPLFPQIGPMNAFGTLSPGTDAGYAFGLRVVVDRHLPSGTLLIGDSTGFECWETPKGAITIDNPSKLTRQVAWRGYFSTLMVDSTKFIKAAFV